MRLESKEQSDELKWLRSRPNTFTYKHNPSPTGIPDIHHIEKGVSFWFETKRSKDHKPSTIQLLRHKQLREAGSFVFVVWKVSQVKKAIRKTLSKTKGKTIYNLGKG